MLSFVTGRSLLESVFWLLMRLRLRFILDRSLSKTSPDLSADTRSSNSPPSSSPFAFALRALRSRSRCSLSCAGGRGEKVESQFLLKCSNHNSTQDTKAAQMDVPELPFWPCAPPPLCAFACSRSPAEPLRRTAGTGRRCQRTHLAGSYWHPHQSALLPSGTARPKRVWGGGACGIRWTAGHGAAMFYSVFDWFTGDSLGLSPLKSEQSSSSWTLKPVLTKSDQLLIIAQSRERSQGSN